MKMNALLKKRAQLEAQIANEQRMQKRRMEVLRLIEKAGALDRPDGEILAALGSAAPAEAAPTNEEGE